MYLYNGIVEYREQINRAAFYLTFYAWNLLVNIKF